LIVFNVIYVICRYDKCFALQKLAG